MKEAPIFAFILGGFGLLLSLVRAVLDWYVNHNPTFLIIFVAAMIPFGIVLRSLYTTYKKTKLWEQEHLMDILKRQ